MMTVEVFPRSALARAEWILAAAGWRGEVAHTRDDDPEGAVSSAQLGRPVLLVPEQLDAGGVLRRILVVHEGNRGDRAGMDAADAAAIASGAEVIVLHVPSRHPSTSPASLPFRMADHAAYDWAEWRDEFLRRFGGCSEGVEVTLKVGSPEELRGQIASERPDLVIASAPGPEPGDGEAMDAVLDSPVPVLIVPSVGRALEGELVSSARRT